MEMPMFAVAIIDDQPVWRSGMERLVHENPQLRIEASVSSVEELDALDIHPDVVVVDVSAQPHGLALAIIARLAKVSRPMVISTWHRDLSIVAAVRAGARACVCRQADQAVVLAALTAVTHGGFYLCQRLHTQFQSELVGAPRDDPNGLAPREVETLQWIARGFTQAQIGTRMGLSQATINTYAKRIRAKLNVSNKADLTRLAIELGHLDDDGADESTHHTRPVPPTGAVEPAA
jgi:DNA-binding NarL/FixJ family response regulator